MTKGTSAHGKRSAGKSHIKCRRCGRTSYHIKQKVCSACGFGKSPRIRKYRIYKKMRSKRSYSHI